MYKFRANKTGLKKTERLPSPLCPESNYLFNQANTDAQKLLSVNKRRI